MDSTTEFLDLTLDPENLVRRVYERGINFNGLFGQSVPFLPVPLTYYSAPTSTPVIPSRSVPPPPHPAIFPSPHSAIPSPLPAWACVLCRSATIWSMSGRYASYWNASLFGSIIHLANISLFPTFVLLYLLRPSMNRPFTGANAQG